MGRGGGLLGFLVTMNVPWDKFRLLGRSSLNRCCPGWGRSLLCLAGAPKPRGELWLLQTPNALCFDGEFTCG